MTRIGERYELCTQIASGGMATVHLARQFGAGGFARIVAVKRLHERLARDPQFVAMFLDEARLVARIRHPNVIQTIDVVVETRTMERAGEAELFIVMEYVHGESLAPLLATAIRAGEAIPPRIAAAVLVDVLRGLHEAHEARSETGEPLGVVHRDVSIHNVLVGVDGIARILDFGVAKAHERITSTSDDQLKGKLSYMSPEQVRNDPVDRRTDVYAAGVVLWELLAGRKLRSGVADAIAAHIVSGPLDPPSALRPEVPADLDAIVLRALARRPEDRYPSAKAMAAALEGALGLATPHEIGAWVSTSCRTSLEARARHIATIEAQASWQCLQAAVDSVRRVSSSGSTMVPLVIGQSPQPPAVAGSLAPVQAPPTPTPAVTARPPSSRRRGSTATAFAVGIATAAVVILGGAAVRASVTRSWAMLPPHPAATPLPPRDAGPALTGTVAASSGSSTCPEGMVLVTEGRFFMGSDDDLPAERPAHHVTLHSFCIDRTEVTSAAYRACSDRGDCKRAGQTNRWPAITAREERTYDPLCTGSNDQAGLHPINCVDWEMADRFCRSAGKRLPTEAEWEYAARGSDGRKYPWGDAAPTPLHLNACGGECAAWLKKRGAASDGWLYATDDGWPTTAPVGSFPAGASRWGAQDMVGNVWEWVSDVYGPYVSADQVDPQGPSSGDSRVIRGGSWNGAHVDWVRSTFRYESPGATRSHGIGFRCAKPI